MDNQRLIFAIDVDAPIESLHNWMIKHNSFAHIGRDQAGNEVYIGEEIVFTKVPLPIFVEIPGSFSPNRIYQYAHAQSFHSETMDSVLGIMVVKEVKPNLSQLSFYSSLDKNDNKISELYNVICHDFMPPSGGLPPSNPKLLAKEDQIDSIDIPSGQLQDSVTSSASTSRPYRKRNLRKRKQIGDEIRKLHPEYTDAEVASEVTTIVLREIRKFITEEYHKGKYDDIDDLVNEKFIEEYGCRGPKFTRDQMRYDRTRK